MRKILLILPLLFFVYCKPKNGPDGYVKDRQTSLLELRQLVNSKEETHQSSGSFFFVIGGYNSSSSVEISVKVFAKVDGFYRVINIPIEKLRVNIDNSLEKPNLIVTYYNSKLSDSNVLDSGWAVQTYIINCPEKYLPEKLLPIEL